MANGSVFEGSWEVLEATLPNGDPGYTGTIAIRELGATFDLEWQITAGAYVGVGLLARDHLLVACGPQRASLGLALLRPAEEGIEVEWTSGELQGGVGTGHGTWRCRGEGAFTGELELEQTLPDGRAHGAWTVTIERRGEVRELTFWAPGGVAHWRGLGLPTAEGLAIAWYPDFAQLALLDYRPAGDASRLEAVWALGGFETLGTETIERR